MSYGYRPWRAAYYVAALIALGTLLFGVANANGVMVPTNGTVAERSAAAKKCTSAYPCFHAFPYAVDVVVPLINLQQRDKWAPDGHHSWGVYVLAFAWASTALGWFLSTLALAGVTGLLDRDR